MAITLITGAPGNGKTLLLLWEVERRRQAEKRPVYYSGVKDLLLPWELFGNDSADPASPHMTDPSNWNTLPVGSIIVIDEAQRLFRNRAVGSKVPDYVAALETHRHKGYDIYLVTQAPALVDSNVRNLVETHKHLMRKFGSRWATIHEWKGVKANCITTRKDSIESQFRYPKEVYTWYKSAEVHTVKVRIPAKVIVLMLLPLGLLVAGWIAWQKLAYLHTPASERGKDPAAISPSQGTQQQQARPMASAAPNWYEGWAPRVPGLPHTAQRYDEVTKPTTAPYPAACLTFGNDCRCYTQQATRMDVDDGLCRDIAANGYFVDWQQPQQQAQQQAQPAQQQPDKPSATLDQPRNVTGSLRPSDPRDADLIAWVHRKPAF